VFTVAQSVVPDEDDVYLPGRQVQQRYNIVEMTLLRWRQDPAVDFPPPLVVHGRNYWSLRDLRAWEKTRTSKEVK
jgi:hypothetical protein